MSNRVMTKRKQEEMRTQAGDSTFIMKKVEDRFGILENSLEDFKKEIRDTFLAMEHSLEALRSKMVELQSELLDWHDEGSPGSMSKH